MASATHSRPNYLAIWLYLFLLTVTEVFVAFVSGMPKLALMLILIALAIWKALLVALFFMHLKFEKWKLRIVALSPLPLAALLVLAVLAERL